MPLEDNLDGIIYRRALTDDIDILAELRVEFLHELYPANPRTAELIESNKEYFQETVPAGQYIAFLAYKDNIPVGVGGMAIQTLPPFRNAQLRRVGYVLNMYTVPEARRSGVGGKIIGMLIDEGKRLGLENLHLRAASMGEGLYRGMGFKEPREVELEFKLNPK
jgi:GNAT superfamily N-acetyltransferase